MTDPIIISGLLARPWAASRARFATVGAIDLGAAAVGPRSSGRASRATPSTSIS